MNNSAISIDGQSALLMSNGIDGGGVVRFNPDNRLNVTIYNRPVHDPEESRRRGRSWTKGVEYIRIQIPGEKDTVDRPLREDDKMRFPQQYAAFMQGRQHVPDGTPVDLLFPQTPEIGLNLHGLGVHTVEQLAGLTEHGASTIGMGATMWRNKAQEYLRAANGGAGMHRLQKQLETKDSQIETLQNQMSLLKGQLDALMARVDQKISPSMVPNIRATVAQQSARFAETDTPGPEPLDYENDFAPAFAQQASNEPLFVEAKDEEILTQSHEVAPRRRPGRPPKPTN